MSVNKPCSAATEQNQWHQLQQLPRLSLTITRSLNVLVVGGGRAGLIKARSALRQQQQVTMVSTEFSDECMALDCWRRGGDIYQWQLADYDPFDLIYFAMPWPNQPERQQQLAQVFQQLQAQGRWVCVSCKPELGNVVNPCSRNVGDYQLALSGDGNSPALTRELTEMLAKQLRQVQQRASQQTESTNNQPLTSGSALREIQ